MDRTNGFHHAVVAALALGQLSCGGSQPAAPTSQQNNLAMRGAVTLGETVPSVQLTLTYGGLDVTNSGTWQSSNTAVATVSSGLVRAVGLGSATISASYKGQTVSAVLPVVADQDCIPYDATSIGIIQDTNDAPPSWTITSSVPGFGEDLLAGADNLTDANNLQALFQRYTQFCFLGRSNTRPNRFQYIVTYFTGASGRQTSIAPEDCVPYSSGALQVTGQGASGWSLASGGTQLALLDTQLEASLLSAVASQASNECFIGRGNTRRNPYAYITEYWK